MTNEIDPDSTGAMKSGTHPIGKDADTEAEYENS